MDEILEILKKDARTSPEDIAKMLGKDVAGVKKAIKKFEDDGIIVQYTAIINQEQARENNIVRALIEVSVAPQKDAGFDDVAERIYSFPEVVSCYLVSGTYDLLVIVEGDNIQTVSHFIASKLSPLEHVRGTTTHFMLKKYKESGRTFKKSSKGKRPNISF
ncbi:MAG: Lrp/AsnC family transcriptional regulator [Candidatus Omnitrophota bacterium]|nr:Lrp/AsnC family transcriptional regulator [Candidatus Omnitrophota bacterium]MDZ4243352.1 Lrp/AsnC family transcriptional regulator [Candidatus Omnitrophota bacterium]